MSIYWDNKTYNGFIHDIGDELYTIFDSDDESRWVCKVKIVAMYPMWADLDNFEEDGNAYNCLSYEVLILHYKNLEELHYEHEEYERLSEKDLFKTLDQAMNKAYKFIDKACSREEAKKS